MPGSGRLWGSSAANRANCLAESRDTSCPSILTSPRSGAISRAATRRRVDFPQPLGPARTVTFPGSKARDTSLSTGGPPQPARIWASSLQCAPPLPPGKAATQKKGRPPGGEGSPPAAQKKKERAPRTAGPPPKQKVNEIPKKVGHKRTEKEIMQGDVYDKDKQTVCPECGSTELIGDYERAEVVCAHCGLVIDENLVDMGPEWRAFDHEQRDKRTRVGAPITYTIHDKGLSTMIDWRNKDIYGRDIPARNRAQWYRLRKWQRKIRISGATERNLAFALSELDRDSSRLGLPRSVREAASVVYRSAVDNKLIRGRSIEGVVAASLYAACRRCNVPRTLDEIAEVSRVTKKEVGRTYRFLTRELNIKLPPTSPVDYVPRFASELGLSGEAQSRAIEIIEKAMEKGLTSGRGPTGVAAAALYIASVLLGERKTQRDVADIAGVTEVTIRNRYKELTEQLEMGVTL